MPQWETFEAFLGDTLEKPAEQRQGMVDQLLREHPDWPWAEGKKATFIHTAMGTENVAVNLDTLPGDPPFAPMTKLDGTNLWYVTLDFESDDLLDYLIAVNDPMTPIAEETDIVARVANHWRPDPHNPRRMHTAQTSVSVLRMDAARPFPDWSKMQKVQRGRVFEHNTNSALLKFVGRKLWVYTPPGYEESNQTYPLMILQDGQWCVGPLQVPFIADTLIKHDQMEPVVIAMQQSGDQRERIKAYVSNDIHYQALLTELLPFVQTHYRIDSANLGVGGVGVGAIAAAHAALMNPAVFSHLIMISPPLGRGPAQDKLREYVRRFQDAPILPKRIFQSVGRYEAKSRFHTPGQVLRSVLTRRIDELFYQYVETGSGHGLVGFRSVLPEALNWTFPSIATTG